MKTAKSTIILWLGGVFMSFLPAAFCQPSIQMRVDVTPREITIGDPISYKAAIQYSSQVAPVPLQISTQTFGEFELLDYRAGQPAPAGDHKFSLTHQFVVTTFSTGTLAIPPLTLYFATADGQMVQANTEEVKIVVQSLLDKFGDEGQLRPLKGLFNFKSYLWLWILLGILGIGAGAFFIIRWINLKRKGGAEPAGPPQPPEVIAWTALHDLEFSGLLADGNIKEFYIRLSQILRQYLENRYQILALERTSTELLSEFRRMNLPLDLSGDLRTTLETGDLVKFAKFTPNDQEIEDDLGRVKKIITVTTPEKKPAEIPEEDKIPV